MPGHAAAIFFCEPHQAAIVSRRTEQRDSERRAEACAERQRELRKAGEAGAAEKPRREVAVVLEPHLAAPRGVAKALSERARFHPEDLSRVFVISDGRTNVEATFADLRRPRISLWEQRQARKALRDARVALQTDAQMSSRSRRSSCRAGARAPSLPPRVRRLLPLKKPSSLAQRDVVQFVLAATGGITGAIAQLVAHAAELAVRDRTEQISLAHLEHVAQVTA